MTRIPVRPWALVLAAGQGKRLSAATGGHSKQFLLWKGVPLYWHSARTLARSGAVAGLVFVFPQDCLEEDRLADAKYGSTKRGIAPVYGDKYMKKAKFVQ